MEGRNVYSREPSQYSGVSDWRLANQGIPGNIGEMAGINIQGIVAIHKEGIVRNRDVVGAVHMNSRTSVICKRIVPELCLFRAPPKLYSFCEVGNDAILDCDILHFRNENAASGRVAPEVMAIAVHNDVRGSDPNAGAVGAEVAANGCRG